MQCPEPCDQGKPVTDRIGRVPEDGKVFGVDIQGKEGVEAHRYRTGAAHGGGCAKADLGITVKETPELVLVVKGPGHEIQPARVHGRHSQLLRQGLGFLIGLLLKAGRTDHRRIQAVRSKEIAFIHVPAGFPVPVAGQRGQAQAAHQPFRLCRDTHLRGRVHRVVIG